MKREIKFCLLLLSSILLLAGCGSTNTTKEDIPLVKTTVIGMSADDTSNTYPGTIKNRNETALSFQVGGRIIAKNVQIGDRVQAGQVLLAINQSDLADQVSNAQGAVAAAKAQADLTQTNLARYRTLYAQQAISRLQLDQAETNYKAASAQLAQAEASLSTSQNQLGYTQITAPSDGIITAVNVEVGQVVAAGQTVATIAVGNEPEAVIALPEQMLSQVAINTPARVTFWALPGVTANAFVREITPVPDPTSRAYTVKLTLPDPPAKLQLGMTATAVFADDKANVIVIPLTALLKNDKGSAVYVVKNETASLVPVTTGNMLENSVEITSGLHQGDRIITAGIDKLADGEKVRL